MAQNPNKPPKYQDRIIRDVKICGGEAVFRGTRVTLRTVLASLAEGDSAEEIVTDFPSLKVEDVQAAIALPRLLQKKTCRFWQSRIFDEDQAG